MTLPPISSSTHILTFWVGKPEVSRLGIGHLGRFDRIDFNQNIVEKVQGRKKNDRLVKVNYDIG